MKSIIKFMLLVFTGIMIMTASTCKSNNLNPEDDGFPDDPNLPVALRTIHVKNATQLTSALTNAMPGDLIVLADGTYSDNFSINRIATRDNPVIIYAANLNQAVITGKFTIKGKFVQVMRIKFLGADARIDVTGDRHKIIACCFEGFGSSASFTQVTAIHLYDRNDSLEIAYCIFKDPAPFRSWTLADGDWPQFRFGIRGRHRLDLNQVSYDVHIHHCHFLNFPPKPSTEYRSAQADGIELAPVFINADTRWIIEYNLFENIKSTDGSIIDVKSGRKDVIRYNTAINCTGRLSIRSAEQTTLEYNWLETTQGICVYGTDHKLIGNRVINGGSIRILRGDNAGPSGTGYDQVKNCLVRCNIGPLRIGQDWSSTGNDFPPLNTAIEGHDPNNISWGVHSGSTVNPDYDCPENQAFKLKPSEVGPEAMR